MFDFILSVCLGFFVKECGAVLCEVIGQKKNKNKISGMNHGSNPLSGAEILDSCDQIFYVSLVFSRFVVLKSRFSLFQTGCFVLYKLQPCIACLA